ncbi:MAG: DeoR family transcriptional regulator [Candidatus Liptonbacteria bacterium]|nr:DeoR family transcriptional regulator [Candidatus Liptonbacteria bacterium]
MREEEAAKVVAKKSYEVSYALCRVASRVKPSISAKLEECAFSIIESASALNIAGIRNSLNLAKNYVRIGADSNLLHKSNADLLLSEILRFDSVLSTLEALNFSAKANLGGVFSSSPSPAPEPTYKRKESSLSTEKKEESPNESERHSAGERQSAILGFVGKTGNCRMKDLMEQFPSTSERTLRYDLQGLVEQGALERVGEGGPGTFYRLKSPSIPLSSGSDNTTPLLGE